MVVQDDANFQKGIEKKAQPGETYVEVGTSGIF